MFKNYLKTAIRNLTKHKGFSIINIVGLAVGMACCILITLYILDELSFDKHHINAENIYRVGAEFGDSEEISAFTPPPLSQAFLDDFPEVKAAVRLSLWPRNLLVQNEEKQFLEKGIIYADSSIFNIFSIPVVYGTADNSFLNHPCTIVLTKSISEKYFGSENPVGKSLEIGSEKTPFEIIAVVEDCPINSHFQFEMIVSLSTSRNSRETSWGGACYFTYILLKENFPKSQLEAKFPKFIKKHLDTALYNELTENGTKSYNFVLEPLLDIHFNAKTIDQLSKKGNITYIYVFSFVALFILIIAIINFVNLSTARYAGRSKEVGLRKTLGSNRNQIIYQFLSESVLISLCSIFFALFLLELALPIFNDFSGKQLEFNVIDNFVLILLLLGIGVLAGILAGSYPAFFLSSFHPVNSLKGAFLKGKKKGLLLKRSLVIIQFTISILVIICTFIINVQLRFMQNAELGFEKDNIVVIHRGYVLGENYESFRQDLLLYPGIRNVCNTETLPGRHFDPNSHRLEGATESDYNTLFTMYGDYDFANLAGLEIVYGRYFSREFSLEENSVIINESAVKKLGLTDPIGTRFYKEFGNTKDGDFVTVVGVVKDIKFFSLHHKVEPMIIRFLSDSQGWAQFTSVKISAENMERNLDLIENKWKKLTGDQPFEYTFLDEDFDRLYSVEQKTGQLITVFSGLSILIASLGLLGLISFSTEQRKKEIGIRKVLGANVRSVIYLLSSEIIILVLISTILDGSIGYFVMGKWLQNFAYHTNIGIEVIILSGLFTMLIGLITVSFQTIKAANANLVKILKYE